MTTFIYYSTLYLRTRSDQIAIEMLTDVDDLGINKVTEVISEIYDSVEILEGLSYFCQKNKCE